MQSATRRAWCLLNRLPVVVRKLMLMIARWNIYAVRVILSVRRLRLEELRLLEQGSYRCLLWRWCDPHTLSRGSGSTYRLSLTCSLAELLQEVLVNLLLMSLGMLMLSNCFTSTCQHSRLAYIIGSTSYFSRMVARTAILVNELIVLALHCRMEALIGYLIIVNTTRSDPTLRVATQMWWSLVPWSMAVYWVLVLLAHTGHLHVQIVRALSWGLWVWVDLIKNKTILAEHVLIGQSWMEGRPIICNILTAIILVDQYVTTTLHIGKLCLISAYSISRAYPICTRLEAHVRVSLGHLASLRLTAHHLLVELGWRLWHRRMGQVFLLNWGRLCLCK